MRNAVLGIALLSVVCGWPAQWHPLPSWPRRSLDSFVLAAIENNGLNVAREADRRTFIRRASFDLIGFAPQTAQYLVAAWKVQNRRKADAAFKPAMAAEESGLQVFLLDLAYLERDVSAKHIWLAQWQVVVAGQDAHRDLSKDAAALQAIERAAQSLQQSLVAAIEGRAAKAVDKPPVKLDQATSAMLKALIDDRDAPLALTKGEVDKHLGAAAKQHLASLGREIETLKKKAGEKYPFAHSLVDGKVINQRIHLRGNYKQLGEEVPRRFLSILSRTASRAFQHGSGRLELARAIASRDNPLTARVFVNRVWQQHFGRGLVGTPSNFGLLGERPTHPELLDHLTARFTASGWSLKQLHREIMLSSTYRLASTFDAANYERDPDNRLLWRMNRRRLDVQAWRDAVLAACGNLDLSVGGPPRRLDDAGNHRRTLYAAISRHELNGVLRLFDFPDPNLTTERRVITTVPMQQLFVMNSEFMVRQAKTLVERLARERIVDESARVEHAYHWVLGRAPSDEERLVALAFLSAAAELNNPQVKLTPWEQSAQVLLATNEFVFVD